MSFRRKIREVTPDELKFIAKNIEKVKDNVDRHLEITKNNYNKLPFYKKLMLTSKEHAEYGQAMLDKEQFDDIYYSFKNPKYWCLDEDDLNFIRKWVNV